MRVSEPRVEEVGYNNEGGYHLVVSQTEKEFVYKNSIYFALLVHTN
jgi:hypothetical protein